MIDRRPGTRQRLAACLQPPGQGFRLRRRCGRRCAAAASSRRTSAPRSPPSTAPRSARFMPTLLAFRDRPASCAVSSGSAAPTRAPLPRAVPRPARSKNALTRTACWRAGRSRRSACRSRRDEIVEVGNLAGASCRAAVRMVAQLPVFLMTPALLVDRLHGHRRAAPDSRRLRRAADRTRPRRSVERRDRGGRVGSLLRDRSARVRRLPARRGSARRASRTGASGH